LSARLRELLHAHLGEPRARAYPVVMTTASSLLEELLDLDCAERDRALDLLAVDAMVTYAFEAACDEPDALSARATDAMRAIGALVAPPLHT
jgi:hypothetical protein